MHFFYASQRNFANGQCFLLENLIIFFMGLIAWAELTSPFIYAFVSGCCSLVCKNSRNQSSNFVNYHNIYCASSEQDWFIWAASGLKEQPTKFPLPWCKFWINIADKRSSTTPVSCIHSLGSLKLKFASGYWRAGNRHGTKTSVFHNFSQLFPLLLNFTEKWPTNSEVLMRISSVQWIFPLLFNMYFKSKVNRNLYSVFPKLSCLKTCKNFSPCEMRCKKIQTFAWHPVSLVLSPLGWPPLAAFLWLVEGSDLYCFTPSLRTAFFSARSNCVKKAFHPFFSKDWALCLPGAGAAADQPRVRGVSPGW